MSKSGTFKTVKTYANMLIFEAAIADSKLSEISMYC